MHSISLEMQYSSRPVKIPHLVLFLTLIDYWEQQELIGFSLRSVVFTFVLIVELERFFLCGAKLFINHGQTHTR